MHDFDASNKEEWSEPGARIAGTSKLDPPAIAMMLESHSNSNGVFVHDQLSHKEFEGQRFYHTQSIHKQMAT